MGEAGISSSGRTPTHSAMFRGRTARGAASLLADFPLQFARAVKYTKRGLFFLESLIYYQKYVLNPFVDVLRIIYTPFQADCFLVHASRDFPVEVVLTLENLYGVKIVQDIAERIILADELFRKAAAETE